jgi:hypothetical protein
MLTQYELDERAELSKALVTAAAERAQYLSFLEDEVAADVRPGASLRRFVARTLIRLGARLDPDAAGTSALEAKAA